MFTEDVYILDWDEKFIMSQQSEELRLALTDWDGDVEGERTCTLISYIQKSFFECS